MRKVLQFSGGKDSLACLYMYKDDPEVVVAYASSGSPIPHTPEFVRRTTKALGMKLYETQPPIPAAEWQDKNGLPVDILPINAAPVMRATMENPPEQALVPYNVCCQANLWEPMQKLVADIGAKIVIRGSRKSDPNYSAADGHIENGITYLSPIWDWSDEDVFAYLRGMGAEIPSQYEQGGDSLDCWCCTAYMDHHGTVRYAYLKEHFPELYAKGSARLGRVRETLETALQQINLEH